MLQCLGHLQKPQNEVEEESYLYVNRSIIGAQFLLEIKARSSRRALSICLRYLVSTTGIAIDELHIVKSKVCMFVT